MISAFRGSNRPSKTEEPAKSKCLCWKEQKKASLGERKQLEKLDNQPTRASTKHAINLWRIHFDIWQN